MKYVSLHLIPINTFSLPQKPLLADAKVIKIITLHFHILCVIVSKAEMPVHTAHSDY